ncbi:MAG: ABC transporter substrate-binding protein [Chloroflexi bacterium]|nr:ABC transporter substrate-binding protein [Chloroflexota bacterium]
MESLVASIAEGAKAVTIGQLNPVQAMLTMRKDVAERLGITEKSPLESRARALKGLTISASGPGGLLDRVARQFMQYGGLNPDRDAEFTYIPGTATMVLAMEQKRVDVLSAPPPGGVIPVIEGYGVVIWVLAREPLPSVYPTSAGIATSLDLASKRPDLLEAVLRAHWRALVSLKQDPEGAIQALKQNLERFRDADIRVLRAALEYTVLPKDPFVTQEVVRGAVETLNLGRPDKISVTFDQVADNRFAEAAKKQLGY